MNADSATDPVFVSARASVEVFLLRVDLLGDIRIECGGQRVVPASAKSLELFCYLVVMHDGSHSREKLAGILWPDEDIPVARRHLRQSLWKLNAALRPVVAGSGIDQAVQSPAPGRLRIHPLVAAGTDLLRLTEAHAQYARRPADTLGPPDVTRIGAALAGYADLLPGWVQDWCTAARLGAREAYLDLQELLAAHWSARDPARAVGHARAAVAVDAARESAHRELMLLHHRLGDRTAAMRQYQLCVTALADEFGVEPSAATLALYRRICAAAEDAGPPPRRPLVAVLRPAPAPDDRPELLAPNPSQLELLAAVSRQLEAVQDTVRQLRQVVDLTHRDVWESASRTDIG